MSANTSVITIHMVSSLDGVIAKKDNSISWFDTTDTYDKGITEQNADALPATIDCYVMGARTYNHAIKLSSDYGWPYGDTPTIVVTNKTLSGQKTNIESYSGDLTQLAATLKMKYNNIWVVGGVMLATAFIRLQLADEIRLSILPIILGDGLLFFNQPGIEQLLHLKNISAYKNGMVNMWYEIKKT